MAAAARCAARRLGGSLLQRTQAAVTGEGPRLVPSRFMRSRQLSTKPAGKIPKELEPSEVAAKVEQKRLELRAKLDKWEKEQPNESTLRWKTIAAAAEGVANGAFKLAALCLITAVVFGDEGESH